MLNKLDVSYVITGHSERRTHEAETDGLVRSRIDAILSHQMTPILCVGETLAVPDAGQAFEHVKRQVASALSGRSSDTLGRVVVANEPLSGNRRGGDGGHLEKALGSYSDVLNRLTIWAIVAPDVPTRTHVSHFGRGESFVAPVVEL
jgi:hypothetical protein